MKAEQQKVDGAEEGVDEGMDMDIHLVVKIVQNKKSFGGPWARRQGLLSRRRRHLWQAQHIA